MRHLYVHVPFCPTICPFCDFHVLTRRAGAVDAYLSGVERDAAELAERFAPPALETVYLGGGTPSHLRSGELERLVSIIRRHLGWASVEATIEAHPGNVSAATVGHWADLGFTRLSIGVQSADDRVLRFLGRSHDGAAALAAVETAVATALMAVSADVITAVPGQDVASDLRAVARLGVDHVSAYTLTIEPGTAFARTGVQVDPEDELAALRTASEVLSGYGMERYEVSNHGRMGAHSQHNQAYWRSRFWLGLGPSASGHEPPHGTDPPGTVAVRRTNPSLDAWLAGGRGARELVDGHSFLTTGVLAGLRLLSTGIDLGELSAVAGLDALIHLAEPLDALRTAGLITLRGTNLRATDAGAVLLDQVAAAFL